MSLKMKFISTRDTKAKYSFQQALFMGYAPDGGLMMPEHIPELTQEEIRNMATLSYVELADKLLQIFIDETEIPAQDRLDCLKKGFASFDCDEVLPIVTLTDNLKVAEMFHGETRAFKDLSMCVVGQLLRYFLSKSNKTATILVGTSGDTGSSAIYAVRGMSNVDIIVLYPKGRVSDYQEIQLVTSQEQNVHVFAGEGTSDDLDLPIRECFHDTDYSEKHSLCSINSINVGRIILQMVPYIYSYYRADSSPVYFLVPTGGAGSISAGMLAQKLGFPIYIIPCVNTNDILHRTLQQGVFKMNDHVYKTYATAIDIQIPYNIERILYIGSNYNTELVKQLMIEVEEGRSITIPKPVYEQIRKILIDSTTVPDCDIIESICSCWSDFSYVICPHTATAITYYYKVNRDEKKYVCLATASPSKFPEVLEDAGVARVPDEKLDSLMGEPKRFQRMRKNEDWLQILKQKIEEITENRNNLL